MLMHSAKRGQSGIALVVSQNQTPAAMYCCCIFSERHLTVQISIATVVTVEQAAQYLAQGDAQAAGQAANLFLKSLVESPRSGTIYPCIRDTECFLRVLANTVQNLTDLEAAAAATVSGQESSQVEAPTPTATLQPTESSPVNGWDTGVYSHACLSTCWPKPTPLHSFPLLLHEQGSLFHHSA